MRAAITLVGLAVVSAYAILGALLMNRWAIVAASGVPLDATIAAMDAAGQPFTPAPGFIFAALGLLLALAAAALTLHPRSNMPHWASIAVWAGILALGAPAYFFSAFANLNSVGDTFYDWNAAAAWALEAPLYLSSGIAFLIAGAALVTAAVSAVMSQRRG